MQKKSEASTRSNRREPHQRRLALLGVRITQERMIEMKIEAARRGMSVADLFEGIWTDYVARRTNQ